MNEELNVCTKNCPICSLQLPLSEFGVCRARKDGRNLYCKGCIRKKVTESRRVLKEYRSARKRCVSQPVSEQAGMQFLDNSSSAGYHRMLGKLSPVERVREAIRKGARTQKQIAQETRLGKDEIGDALANLLLWTREIKTHIVENVRVYSINESSESSWIQEDTVEMPQRKGDLQSSFSAVPGLMPGKNSESEEPERIVGWVAA